MTVAVEILCCPMVNVLSVEILQIIIASNVSNGLRSILVSTAKKEQKMLSSTEILEKWIELWSQCTLRDSNLYCEGVFPNCEDCFLIDYGFIRLPRIWKEKDLNQATYDDLLQLHEILMRHIRGDCTNCLLCAIETPTAGYSRSVL